jgi:hypothetical protein
MKYSLFACLVLSFSISFAQLTVTNSSYIFVDGNGFTPAPNVAPLFVTNAVNLTGANSNIYLRNEAQLLQGNGTVTSTNSGIGQLSIYQTGTVNQWAYNYWCSPVGNNSTATGNEDARVALLNDATGLITSVPAAFTTAYNGSASPLTISTRWLWTYQTSSLYADWAFVGDTGPIAPGLGFTMKGNGTAATGSQLYDFRGKPNNGTMANAVTANAFTLVGNPYPSAMDSAAFIHDTQNAAAIDGTLFYWEQDASIPLTQSHVLQDYVGGYSEFTINSSGVIISNVPATFWKYDEQDNVLPLPPGPPGSGTKMAQRYIPIGQGFMVQGLVGTSGTVRAKNSHRIFQKEGANSYFFRSNNPTPSSDNVSTSQNSEIQFQDNGLSIVPEDYKRFRINVEFSANGVKYVRQMLLNFHDSATMGFDYGLELSRADNLDNDAYFTLGDKAFSGQAYPFEEALVIPLVVDIAEQQPLRFRIFDIQNFDDTQGIYIHDNEDDTYVNLRNLHYDLNIEPGHYTDRFEIVFTPQGALSIDDLDINTLTINQNNNTNQLSVLNPKNLDVRSIEVYDIAGKRLLQNKYDTVLNRYELSTTKLSDGVYVVNVLGEVNNTVKSQKIIIKN